MKYIATYENFENLDETFYSCIDPVSFNSFIEIEVYDKKTFTNDDIVKWMENYFITLDDKVVWVCQDQSMCYKFNTNEEQLISKYTLRDGFIITESKDSNCCYLMILRDSYSQN